MSADLACCPALKRVPWRVAEAGLKLTGCPLCAASGLTIQRAIGRLGRRGRGCAPCVGGGLLQDSRTHGNSWVSMASWVISHCGP